MSEEDILDITERIANHGWSDYDNLEENKKAIQGLLDLYYKQQKEKEIWKETENDYEHELARKDEKIEKQQKEIDILQTKIKQNENIEKIKMCMTHNIPNNIELVCMAREDFERNFGNDYISKDKIRDKIKELEDDKYEHLLARENIIKTLKELLGEKDDTKV